MEKATYEETVEARAPGILDTLRREPYARAGAHDGVPMITDYLFLAPGGEVFYDRQEIREYVERHYGSRHPCSYCGCYLIPTGQTRWFLFRVYRCANSICSASFETFRLRSLWYRHVA